MAWVWDAFSGQWQYFLFSYSYHSHSYYILLTINFKTMQKTLLLFSTLLTFSTFGQVPMSDSKTKLTFISDTAVKITNLQSCTVDYLVKIPSDTIYYVIKGIGPGQSTTKGFPTCGEFRAIPVANCDGSTCGKVGFNTCTEVLAVVPEIKWRQSDDKKYLEGEVKEINPNKTYQAKVGFADGTVVYYPAELIRKGTGYYLKIKL